MTERKTTCDPERLRLLLADEMPPELAAEVTAHIAECPKCREILDSLAGDEHWWTEVTRCLKGSVDVMSRHRGSDASSVSRDSATDANGNTFSADFAVDFLQPCEQPGTLGRLDDIEILELIGHGGMGVIFKGFQRELGRYVAVKLMAPHLAASGSARKRFIREARAVAAIVHPHVMAIHSVNSSGRLPYLVMPYVACESLEQRLDREGPLELKEILRIGHQVALGLAAAHAQGLVHRDVKPANILLEKGVDRVMLTDFGLARAADDASLTKTGVIAGTPRYMSPEQARGEAIDHRTDLFSLGSVMYSMCTGRPPFRAETSYGVLRRITDCQPRPIREINADIPQWLCAIIDRLLTKDPDLRFQTAADVAELLGRCLAHVQNPEAVPLPELLNRHADTHDVRKAARRKWAWVGEGFALSALLMGGAVLLIQQSRSPSASEETRSTEPADLPTSGLHPVSPYLVHRFQGHDGPVGDVDFSADGQLALSCSGWPKGDKTIRLWNVSSGEEIRQFQTLPLPDTPGVMSPRALPGEVTSVAFGPEGRWALSGGTGGLVRLWDVETGTMLRQLVGHEASIYSVAIAPDGRRAATGGRDRTIRIWDVTTGRELHRLDGHSHWVRSVAFSHDGRRVLSGSCDKTMRLWDAQTGEPLRAFDEHDAWVDSVALSSDSRLALSASTTATLWDVESGRRIRRFDGHLSGLLSIAFSPDDRQAVSAGYDGTVRLWDVATGEEICQFRGHRGWTSCVAFSPDGRHVLSGGGGALEDHVELWTGDYALRLWRVPDPIAPVSEEAGGSSQVPGRTATTSSAIKGRSYQHQGAAKTTIAVPPGTLLTDAIRQFNQRQKQHPIGGEQPPLTDDEVIASIRYTEKTEAPASIGEIEAALDKKADVESIQKADTLQSFADALAKQLGVPVTVDKRSLENLGYAPDTDARVPEDLDGVTVRSVLRHTLDRHALDYILADGAVVITTAEEAERRLDTRVYAIGDLPTPAKDVVATILTTVSPHSWDKLGGPGSIRALAEGEKLAVHQTQRVHEQVTDLLKSLKGNSK